MKLNIKKTILGLTVAAVLAVPSFAFAEYKADAAFNIAVASNFNDCMGALVAEYEDQKDIVVGWHHDSSGNLVTDITANPMKYQMFFSADDIRPAALQSASPQRAVKDDFYAEGTLVGYSETLAPTAIRDAVLNKTFTSIAAANYLKAPYGVAAKTMLTDLGVYTDSRVTSNYDNIALTLAAAVSGGKQIALVSQGQVWDKSAKFYAFPSTRTAGEDGFYEPILQNMCLLLQTPGTATSYNAAADAFMTWYKTNSKAKQIVRDYGYNI